MYMIYTNIQTERDYLEAKSCNDEFATTFNTTAQNIKKKIKVVIYTTD